MICVQIFIEPLKSPPIKLQSLNVQFVNIVIDGVTAVVITTGTKIKVLLFFKLLIFNIMWII